MSKKMFTGALTAAMLTAIAVPALAYDMNSSGQGFVGKGELQTPWGLNNSGMNSAAGGVTFSLAYRDTYTATCEWESGPTHNRRTHEVTVPRNIQVASTVTRQVRTNPNSNVTGFILTGLSGTTTNGTIPVVGGACVGTGGQGGLWVEVSEPVTTGGDLLAHHALHPTLTLVPNPVPLS